MSQDNCINSKGANIIIYLGPKQPICTIIDIKKLRDCRHSPTSAPFDYQAADDEIFDPKFA